MGALYSHTTRSTGTILTANIYNTDHQNHIDNGTPQMTDDYSANAAQMQSAVDPGENGSESLPTSLAGELERLRFMIKEMKDWLAGASLSQWYSSLTGTAPTTKGDIIARTSTEMTRVAVGSNGSTLMADSSQTTGLAWAKNSPRSMLMNPFMQVNQRQGSSVADDTYTVDRWYALTESNPISYSVQTNQDVQALANIRLTQSNAAAQRIGLAQILEAQDTKLLPGRTMTFSPRVRVSTSQAVRVAILYWKGLEDSVVSDVVNDWTNGTFTTGNFFNGANLEVGGVATVTPLANVFTDIPLTVTIGLPINVIVMVWTEGVAAQNFNLDITKARFVEGTYAGDIYEPKFGEVLDECKRYYQKSFSYATTPAQNVGTGKNESRILAPLAGAVVNTLPIRLPVRMRTINGTVVTYNPAAANAHVRNITDGADFSNTSATMAGDELMLVTSTGTAGTAAGEQLGIHWTVEAEL